MLPLIPDTRYHVLQPHKTAGKIILLHIQSLSFWTADKKKTVSELNGMQALPEFNLLLISSSKMLIYSCCSQTFPLSAKVGNHFTD
jgi:hypothetical protein